MTNPRMKNIPRWKNTQFVTRPSNAALITALEVTRRKLINYPVNLHRFGICWCLPVNSAGAYLCEYISNALGQYSYIHEWLQRHRPHHSRSYQSIRKARLMWIDWMIASLEGKEYQP